jgi:chromosome segregation ATPase
MMPEEPSEDSTMSMSDALSLRHKYTTIAAAHSSCASRLAQLSSTNVELGERLKEVSRESLIRIGELETRLDECQRELRWEKGTREAGERKLRLAREELELLRVSTGFPAVTQADNHPVRQSLFCGGGIPTHD